MRKSNLTFFIYILLKYKRHTQKKVSSRIFALTNLFPLAYEHTQKKGLQKHELNILTNYLGIIHSPAHMYFLFQQKKS
jgi:hypothetical protein